MPRQLPDSGEPLPGALRDERKNEHSNRTGREQGLEAPSARLGHEEDQAGSHEGDERASRLRQQNDEREQGASDIRRRFHPSFLLVKITARHSESGKNVSAARSFEFP